MKYLFCIIIVLSAFFSTSCGTLRFNKTSDFATLSDANKLDGYYYNWTEEYVGYYDRPDRKNAVAFFEKDSADFIHMRTEGNNKLIISYTNTNGKHEEVYEGELKKKFFEIYYKKDQIIIPLIFSNINVDRLRIGKTKNGELLINHFVEGFGNLLLFAGGSGGGDNFYRFNKANIDTTLIPVKTMGKWGYADSLNNIIIPCRYEYVTLFDNGIAQAKLNGKWGIINRHQEVIIPFAYDKIIPFYGWGYKVYSHGKSGILSWDGKEIIPIVYDYIAPPEKDMSTVKIGQMWGRITNEKILIPAIYSVLEEYSATYFIAERNKTKYLVDKDGYEYGIRGKSQLFKKKLIPDLDTKRKIRIEEQNILIDNEHITE